MFMTLLAVFQILLTRYTGQRDILVGAPIAGRTHANLEDLMGFFVNTLVLRTQILGQPTFHEVLRQVRKTCLEAYRHQDLPFEKLVEVLKPVRDPRRHPIIQAIFQLRKKSDAQLSFPKLTAHRFPVKNRTGNFDLHMVCEETEAGIEGFLYYPKDLFSDSMMAGFSKHFQILLKELIDNPQQPVTHIPFLTEEETQQQLVEWNARHAEYGQNSCVHELFEAQVLRTPEAVAVECHGTHLTYQELNRLANQLAQRLRERGVGPETPVGLLMKRSAELVISVFGILKAGGTYIPLDPAYPEERIRYMLEDSQAAMLVTHTATQQMVSGNSIPVVSIDNCGMCRDSGAELSNGHLPAHQKANNLAYILYTSGSTGRPKGVAIEHRNVVNFLHWIRGHFTTTEFEGVLASTSICFDLSIFELFGPLSWGGTVILAKNALELADLPSADRITLINTVPSAVKALLHARAIPSSVQVVNLAGEPLTQALVTALYRQPHIQKVYDLYGPSEATTYTTGALRTAHDPATIGQPLPNTQAYVLDAEQCPVPVGIPGELYIGGDGLARGYWQQPGLTSKKFVPDHLGNGSGGRLYRTGDLVRYRQTGDLEFLGRMDHQVKVRGFRIELGEIQANLLAHSRVQECVVMVRTEGSDEPELVAYVVSDQEMLSIGDLRQYLKQTLPDYMVPTVFVMLEALPLTPNGKIDRKALQALEQNRTDLGTGYVSPRTSQEKLLVEIWRNVLKIDQIGIHDNFFELGGHSLLAIKIISQIQVAFSTDLSLQTLFEAPTIEELVDHLPQIPEAQGTGHVPLLSSSPRPSPLPLSYTQERFWFLDQYLTDREIHTVSVAFRLKGPLNIQALADSVNEIVSRHEILRTTFPMINGQPQVVILPTLTVDLPCISLEEIPEERRHTEVQRRMKDIIQAFDLAQGPLIRVTLLKFQENDHLFLHAMHHIITDAWSKEIFHKELATLYQAFCAGQPSPLPPLPLQYVDFSLWQREQVEGPMGYRELAYWRKQLADAPPSHSLPTDYPRGVHQTFRGARMNRQLSREFTHSLQKFKTQQSSSLFMILLAGLQILLHRHTGMTDIVVGSIIAGRNHMEHEQLLGCFLNTLALRAHISEDVTFSQFLVQIRQTVFDAMKHQNLPFEKIVTELHPRRDLSRPPFFQVLLNMHNFSDKELELSGLTTNQQAFPDPNVFFDLTLYFQEYPDCINLTLSYNADLFDRTTIAWLFDHYETLLQGLLDKPDAPVSTVSIFGDTDRHLPCSDIPVVVPEPQSFCSFPSIDRELSLPQRFEQLVSRYPQHVAVQTSETNWTYEELNRQANRVAHTLCGVLPDQTTPVPVGLMCTMGAPMLAALIGILKTGHPYVPLEPNLPLSRLETIAADATLTTILCTPTTLENASSLRLRGYQIIPLDEEHLASEDTNPQIAVSSDALAYLLYTSGTTGVPKGVLQTHRNVLHHIRTYTNNLKIGPHDRLTLLSSYSFDAAIMDIFGALLNGATLYPFNLLETGPEALSPWLAQQAITLYHSTPTVYRYWLKNLKPGDRFPSLRLIVLGGEEATRDDFEAYQRFFGPDCLFVNGLGPTESTLSLQFIGSHETRLLGQTVPVGYPVEDTQVVLLDDTGRVNELHGEITLRSRHVALGYWQRTELTQYAFSGPPYPDGIRQYRTGDMGRYRSDGTLEFMGRKDAQIKLRGYRIELGEIESVLVQHSAIKNAVVLCREDTPGDKQLVAYVVPTSELTLNPATFRQYLQNQLPDYMLPAAFVRLNDIPLRPNGKLDRQSLPVPKAVDRIQSTNYVAPRTVLQELLVEVWQEVLTIERIGIHDHFFDIGGHSLLAAQVIARLRQMLELDIPLRSIFEHPTIAQLASVIDAQLANVFPDWPRDESPTSSVPSTT